MPINSYNDPRESMEEVSRSLIKSGEKGANISQRTHTIMMLPQTITQVDYKDASQVVPQRTSQSTNHDTSSPRDLLTELSRRLQGVSNT